MATSKGKLSKAQQIKLDLKSRLKYNQRMVSVRENPCGLSWSFTFTIRDPKVNLHKLSEFVISKQSIDRCDHSGEILSGANTFIHITMTQEVINSWSENYLQILSTITPDEDSVSKSYNLNDKTTIHQFHDSPHSFRIIDSSRSIDISCPSSNMTRLSTYLFLIDQSNYNQDSFEDAIRKVQFPLC